MGRKYSVVVDAQAGTAAQDLVEINAAATKPVIIHEVRCSQSSDAGDAQDEMLQLKLVRGHTTSGSGGSAVTPTPLDPGDAAFGGTCERNNTTQATGGTPVTLLAEGFNVRAGFIWLPTPECRPVIAANTRAVLSALAPADSLTFSVTIVLEEIG